MGTEQEHIIAGLGATGFSDAGIAKALGLGLIEIHDNTTKILTEMLEEANSTGDISYALGNLVTGLQLAEEAMVQIVKMLEKAKGSQN